MGEESEGIWICLMIVIKINLNNTKKFTGVHLSDTRA